MPLHPIYLEEGLALVLNKGPYCFILSLAVSLSAQLRYTGGTNTFIIFFLCTPFFGGRVGMKRKLGEKREASGIPGEI